MFYFVYLTNVFFSNKQIETYEKAASATCEMDFYVNSISRTKKAVGM